MISQDKAVIDLVSHCLETQRKSWYENIESTEEMISDLDSSSPHTFVAACIASGMSREDIIKEWSGE